MNLRCIAIDIAQLLVGSLLLFLLMALAIEGCLRLFKVDNPRLRLLCRCLPLFKLPLAMALHRMGEGINLLETNILNCNSYLKPLMGWLFLSPEQLERMGALKMPLPQFLALQVPMPWLSAFVILILAISVAMSVRKLLQLCSASRYLNRVCREASYCSRRIVNTSLRRALDKQGVVILVSTEVCSPLAHGRTHIVLPATLLEHFSQEEFEAVAVHELEHLRWRDPLLKAGLSLISAFFWWIPMRWWLKKIDDEQELACDACISRYQFSSEQLANAVVKTLRLCLMQSNGDMLLTTLARHSGSTFLRIQKLLHPPALSSGSILLAPCGAAAALACFLTISFHIC